MWGNIWKKKEGTGEGRKVGGRGTVLRRSMLLSICSGLLLFVSHTIVSVLASSCLNYHTRVRNRDGVDGVRPSALVEDWSDKLNARVLPNCRHEVTASGRAEMSTGIMPCVVHSLDWNSIKVSPSSLGQLSRLRAGYYH